MKRFLWLLFSAASLLTCQKKEELSPRDYPRLITQAVTDVNESGATFRGELLTPGTSPVIEYGFVWSTGDQPRLDATTERLVVTGTISPGPFEARIDFGLRKDASYFVRAFARTGSHTVYGTLLRFSSRGCPAPRIASFAPRVATIGDTLVIKGERFSSFKDQLKVYFVYGQYGIVEARVVSTNNREVVCIVPTQLSLQYSKTTKIQVVAYGQSTTSQDEFNLDDTKPVITRFSPETGTFGDQITITGTSFSIIASQNTVLLGGVPTPVLSASKTRLVVEVPATILKKTNQVAVSRGEPYFNGNQPSLAPGFFVMKGPRITTIQTPTSGSTFTITGENFNREPQNNLVQFGPDDILRVKSSTTTSLEVPISNLVFPQPTTTFTFQVTTSEQTDQREVTFTNRNPWVKRANERIAPFNDGSDWYSPRKPTSFVVNGKAYVMMGRENFTDELRLYEYSPDAYSWRRLGAPPSVFQGYSTGSAFVINGKAYVILQRYESNFWEYDPARARWQALPDVPECVRYATSRAFALDGKGYILLASGGCSGGSFWEYDPSTVRWQNKPSGVGIASVVDAFEAGNRTYVLLEGSRSGSGRLMEYANGTWTEKAGLDVEYISSLSGFWVAGQLVLTNGLRTYRYDPGQNRWSVTSTGPSEVRLGECQGFAVGNRAFLFYSGYMGEYALGRSVNTYLHFWEFDPTR